MGLPLYRIAIKWICYYLCAFLLILHFCPFCHFVSFCPFAILCGHDAVHIV
ncbi:unnamed protein product [Meloidogyne enterolobii]|uniref:Uncharacterized protein n=1 Tax=Meloidogyne enterolobii TaxID=390850 RepID=A0ACB0YWK2_MELEN